jgi:hypothetical protein
MRTALGLCSLLLLLACPPLPTEKPLGPCPLPQSSDGRCPVDNYNEQVRCFRMHDLLAPRTVADLQNMVKEAARERERLRARGAGHSTTTQICTSGTGIDMRKLRPQKGTRRVEVRKEDGKLMAEAWAGLPLFELAERVYAAGGSIGFSMIGFRQVTVGGVLANGAHGSALTESTLLASRVRGLTLVDAEGKLEHYRWDPQRNEVLVRPGTPEITASPRLSTRRSRCQGWPRPASHRRTTGTRSCRTWACSASWCASSSRWTSPTGCGCA